MKVKKYITFDKLDNSFVLEVLNDGDSECGSFVIFEGRVRKDKVGGRFVEKIFYESYVEMAEKEIGKIEFEAREKFGVDKIVIKHRVGEVMAGEVSFFVAVFSKHRDEGFKAIQYIINQVKSRAPIWKKEILTDGKHRWV